jgi:hypothetical protein
MERIMKLYNFLVGIIVISFTFYASPATVNGRFTILGTDSLKFTVLLQINTDSGTDYLGGSTIVFEFDTTAINFVSIPENNVDYVFHNFSGGNYSPASVTRPMRNKIWINIDLPFSNSNTGTVVSEIPGWTDVVTIHFDIVDTNTTAALTWLTTSPFWGIYDGDNSTLWQTGVFENLFGPLPVELISFTGLLLPDKSVLLEWKTASSLNNYGFEIQKSYLNSSDWEIIGFVENTGDPNSLTEYSFTDHTTHKFPVVKYRLKSIDNDGSYQFSDVIEINTLPTSYELSQNYPNPFNPSTTIQFSLPIASQIKITVYNMIGELVATIASGNYEAGYHKVTFNASSASGGLSSGIYIYRLESADFIQVKKMVLIK